MSVRTIICNGTIVTASDIVKADIIVEGGKITTITDAAITRGDDQVIDARGQYVFPGGIDVHTHLAWPSQDIETADDFVTGSKAAAVGGITSIVNFTKPALGQGLIDNLHEWKEKAKPSAIDFGFHSIVVECNNDILEEIPVLAVEGVTSIKLFMAYKGNLMVGDNDMYRLMKKAGESGMLTNIHAENGDLIDQLIEEALAESKTDPIYHAHTRPTSLEAEATSRALTIAELAGAPVYIVHVSCAEALQRIESAKERGVQAYAETCPQYLVLDLNDLDRPGFEGGKYVCSPPLREKWNQNVLWKAIASGSISVVGSDHCPFQFEGQKTLGRDNFALIPNGVPGIEDMFSLLYHFGVHEGRISLNKFVEIMSTNPAKIFGLHPNKGSIAVGADADLVLLDPQRSRTITCATQYQNVDYNLYEGTMVQGAITHVLSRGELIAKDGQFVGQLGRGRYIYRNKVADHRYVSNHSNLEEEGI
jgi:dihydropyrimidinase